MILYCQIFLFSLCNDVYIVIHLNWISKLRRVIVMDEILIVITSSAVVKNWNLWDLACVLVEQ